MSDVKSAPAASWQVARDSAKERGNSAFTAATPNLVEAVKHYSEAIQLSYPPAGTTETATDRMARSVLYANRAAAHLKASAWNEAISDCSAALKLNSQYTKALFRRATAYEALALEANALPQPSTTGTGSTGSGKRPPASKFRAVFIGEREKLLE